jgi:hypothetical protein
MFLLCPNASVEAVAEGIEIYKWTWPSWIVSPQEFPLKRLAAGYVCLYRLICFCFLKWTLFFLAPRHLLVPRNFFYIYFALIFEK